MQPCSVVVAGERLRFDRRPNPALQPVGKEGAQRLLFANYRQSALFVAEQASQSVLNSLPSRSVDCLSLQLPIDIAEADGSGPTAIFPSVYRSFVLTSFAHFLPLFPAPLMGLRFWFHHLNSEAFLAECEHSGEQYFCGPCRAKKKGVAHPSRAHVRSRLRF